MEWLAETVAKWGRPHTMLLKDRTLGGAAQEDLCRQGTDADGITATGYGRSALTVWGSTGRGSSSGFFMPPPGPGPAQMVKALGPPMQQPGTKASKQCFNCQQYGHYASECTMGRGPHPGM